MSEQEYKREEAFRRDLEQVINKHSMENGSNTPDFILAIYLTECLRAFDVAVGVRERWYGRENAGPLNRSEEIGLAK